MLQQQLAQPYAQVHIPFERIHQDGLTPTSIDLRSRYRKRSSPLQKIMALFVLAALSYGIVQFTFANGMELYKVAKLMRQQVAVEHLHQNALQENRQLQESIKRSRSVAGIEELARNQLDMVGNDEILVRFL